MAEFSGYYPAEVEQDQWGQLTYHALDVSQPDGESWTRDSEYYALSADERLYAVGVLKEKSDNNQLFTDTVELTMLAVPAWYRGGGYGGEMLRRLENVVRQKGAVALVAQVANLDHGLWRSYEHVPSAPASVLHKVL